jgi:hypothetical protein
MIVLNTKQTLLATSEIEKVRWRGCSKWLIFFTSVFFAEVLKTDNMNTEDLQQQTTIQTFSESTGVLSLSRVRPNSEYGTGKERGVGSVWGYVA